MFRRFRSALCGVLGAGVMVVGAWSSAAASEPNGTQTQRASAGDQSAAAAGGNPQRVISSNGRVPATESTGSRVYSGSNGSGIASRSLLAPASGPRGDPGDTGRESVIGTDDRTQNTNTSSYPYRAVAQILFTTPDGDSLCTGWLISRNTVTTAGHCVYEPGAGFYDISSYEVIPGRNGDSAPFGTCGARTLFTVNGWANSADEEFDYGAIKLNCNVGDDTGWFSFFWTADSLDNQSATVTGYPGDKPFGTQWQHTSFIAVTNPRQLFYDADTFGGNSGGPVWASNTAQCSGACGFAIHAYGLHGSAPHNAHNHGTRITQGVFNNLVSWVNAK